MKILLANKFFYPKGGSETVMFQEREFLLGSGVEVVDFSMHDERNLASPYQSWFVSPQDYSGPPRGGALQRVGSAVKLVHSPEAVRNIGKLIDLTQPDLVHCHNVYHQLTPSIIGAAKRRGIPVALTLHDYKPICPVYTRLRNGECCSKCANNDFCNVGRYRCADGSLAHSLLLYAEAVTQRVKRSYERVDVVIAPSRFMADAVSGSRFDAARVHVLYNGVDAARIEPSDVDGGYLLYLGRLSAEKGIETLLRAQAQANAAPVVVAGTGPMEAQLRARYPKVDFRGYLGGAELEDTIRRASAIVIPSEWYENCPMSVLEAMAYGKPVIGSDIGGIPELVEKEVTGLLFPPGDAQALAERIGRLMGDHELRKSFGRAARQRLEREFSLQAHNRGLMRLYREAIRSPVNQNTYTHLSEQPKEK
jgi:glycosyltransferase involved in cell wall biosynthesis